jgi:crossover junction endonuclease MUS81
MLTEEGKKTARDCLARSGLDDTAGPSTYHNVEVVLSDSDSHESYPCDSDSDEPTLVHLTSPFYTLCLF